MRVMRRFLVPAALVLLTALASAALIVGLRASTNADKAGSGRDLDKLQQTVGGQSEKVSALEEKLEAQSTQIATLSKQLTAQQKRLAKICDDKTVASMRSQLYGEQSAYNSPDYNYFGNLTGIIDAACGPEWDEAAG